MANHAHIDEHESHERTKIEQFYGELESHGKLYISGVLADEEDKISASLKTGGFRIVDKRFRAEWLGIFAVRE